MNIEAFRGPGSTPSRRRFWDDATKAVLASRKIAGRNVSIDEHIGKGTVINVNRVKRSGGGGIIGCPSSISVTVSGVTAPCGCQDVSFDHAYNVTTLNLNGTWTLPKIEDDSWGCNWALYIDDILIGLDRYDTCDGTLIEHITGSPYFYAGFAASDNKWYCVVGLGSASSVFVVDTMFFYGGGSTDSTHTISNDMTCSTSFHPTSDWYETFFGFSSLAAGSGGTVTLSP